MSDSRRARSDRPNSPEVPDAVDAPVPPGQTPLGLDYFAAHAPDRKASGAAAFAFGLVVVSLLPFACGVINVAVAANSYSPTITGSHRGGAVLFLAVGVLLCGLALARLISLRHWTGVLVAAAVLTGQLAIVACTGVAMM